jgi:hypothetical protein
MDIATISSLVSSLKLATDITKLIRESDVSVERAETKLKFAALIEALAEAKITTADVKQEILDRDVKIIQLQAVIDTKSSLTWKQPYYYSADESLTEQRYCQKCFDSKNKLSRLHTVGSGAFHCTVCSCLFLSDERLESDLEASCVKNEEARDNLEPISVDWGPL